MSQLVGVQEGLVLIEVTPGTSVIVDTDGMTAFDPGPTEELQERLEWGDPSGLELDPAWVELAEAAVEAAGADAPADVEEVMAAGYRPPAPLRRRVREAIDEKIAKDPTDLFVGKLLASGRPIDADAVHGLNRFFENFSGDESSPSFRLRGGALGRRWARERAQVIVASAERSNSYYYDPQRPEQVYTHVVDDVYERWTGRNWRVSYPNAAALMPLAELDAQKRVETLTASVSREERRQIREYERELAERAIPEIDWTLIDEVFALDIGRSSRAKTQVRDGNGRFAKVGARVTSPGAPGEGTIRAVNEDGTVDIEYADGSTAHVNARDVEVSDGTPPREGLTKARLPQALPIITDTAGFLGRYAASITPASTGDESAPPPVTAAGEEAAPPAEAPPAEAPAEAAPEAPTPSVSAPQPLHIAIVDDVDTEAVLDLVQITPAGAGQELQAHRRESGQWVPAPDLLSDLQGGTPPPVVELDAATLDAVLEQVDSFVEEDTPEAPPAEEAPAEAPAPTAVPVTAALRWDPTFAVEFEKRMLELAEGGTDKNRGNAEELRRYWSKGKGAAKIRWGTDGDFDRCVNQLRKYLGARAKGYCALRHREAVGDWPGKGRHLSLREASLTAAGPPDRTPPDTAGEVPEGGKRFRIRMLLPEGVESGDGRTFALNSASVRDLPLPLLWQEESEAGHDGSIIVGRIDRIDRIEGGLGNAYGVFDTSPEAQEAARMVEEGFLRGVSADLDAFEAEVLEQASAENQVTSDKLEVKSARVMAATLVAKPAFQECVIEIMGDTGEFTEQSSDSDALAASALVAAAAPVHPPKEWFDDPRLEGPTPINVTDDGRVFGHVATWDVDHIGLPYGTRAPRSASNYAYFKTGVLRTAEQEDVHVGQLTLAGGHAPLSADAAAAVKHYDDTASAVADVSAGEDRYGIWVAGALRPSVTAEQVRALRASAPSGDWRPINGTLEMVAVCQVNVPGFPVARARVASGQVQALVAAGARHLAELRDTPARTLEERLAALEGAERARLEERKLALRARVAPLAEQRHAALVAAVEAARAKVAPLLEAEQTRRDALVAAAEAARARVAALRAVKPWTEEDERKHPRDDEGRWREVIASLEDLVGNTASDEVRNAATDALGEVRKAEALDEAGDREGAENATSRVAAKLGDALAAADNPDDAAGVERVVARLSGGPADELIEEAEQLLERGADRIVQQVDPIENIEQQLRQFLEGRGFTSPEDFANFLRRLMTDQ